jgi:hypothetical protein
LKSINGSLALRSSADQTGLVTEILIVDLGRARRMRDTDPDRAQVGEDARPSSERRLVLLGPACDHSRETFGHGGSPFFEPGTRQEGG